LNSGLNTLTSHLNNDVAVRVAATLINAVVAAVVIIVEEGIGTSISVNGISTICASGGVGGLDCERGGSSLEALQERLVVKG
jgi:hypothetical protein